MNKESNKDWALLQQIWLLSLGVLLIAMIILGGYTRLTDSGLSIVEWKPAAGTIPPMSSEAWQEEFAKYMQTPEYMYVNKGMSLEEFKFIYLVEYFHRLLGRVIGLVFFAPLVLFAWKGRLDKINIRNFFIIALLGIFQAGMGWYMVKSGLSDNPQVSHWRLAFHLITALLIYGLVFWNFLNVSFKNYAPSREQLNLNHSTALVCSLIVLLICIVQIFFGGLVAGLKAGYIYNSFPLMDGKFIPQEMFETGNQMLQTPAAVQFLHRLIAYLLFILGVSYAILLMRSRQNKHIYYGALLVLASLVCQTVLGIATVLLVVPTFIALLHQLMGILLFTSLLYLHYVLIFIKNYNTREGYISR
jgi:cytochrome c oxidase assembly protein subunit 15